MPRNLLAASLLLALCLVGPLAGQSAKKVPATGPVDEPLAPFDKMMCDFLEAHPEIPGATLAVARDGHIVYSRGFRHADGNTQMAPAAKMRVASISKPITA